MKAEFLNLVPAPKDSVPFILLPPGLNRLQLADHCSCKDLLQGGDGNHRESIAREGMAVTESCAGGRGARSGAGQWNRLPRLQQQGQPALQGRPSRSDPAQKGWPRILLVGYNGANNTGSEARLLRVIDDVRAVFGPEALITVPTLNERNLRRYVREEGYLRIVPIPAVYPLAVRMLVKHHDLIMLIEGSCYMDTWGSPLLWAYLLATHCAHSFGRPCLAYAVDAGEVSGFNRRLVRREGSRTDLIITRTRAAADRLVSWGVTAPMEVTADNAFAFSPEAGDSGFLRRAWPEAPGVAGIAVEDVFRWPVTIRPWGPRAYCYRWPYYYGCSREGCLSSDALAAGLAREADRLVERYGKYIALICMEELDGPFALKVQRRMRSAGRSRIFSAGEYDASKMTALLRGLELLITSRYHAGVLSLAAQVPQTAIGHDLRIWDLYGDLGIRDDYFGGHCDPAVYDKLSGRVDRLISDRRSVRGALRRGYEDHVAREGRNRELLRAFAESHRLVAN